MGGNCALIISRKRKCSEDQDSSYERRKSARDDDGNYFYYQACQVVVDGRETVSRVLSRGFTKPRSRLALLPYHKELEKWCDEQMVHLETGMTTAVLVNEPVPALYNFMIYFVEFIERYGHRFEKPKHIRFIKFFYLLMTKEGQWHEVVHLSAQILEKLIGGSRLTRSDLQLDWKPVYKIYYECKYGKIEDVEGDKIAVAVMKLKRFYPLEASKEIWEQLQIHISPRYSNKTFCNLCSLFLSSEMTAEEHKKYGAVLWWDTLWGFLNTVEMGHFWGDELPPLFASVYYHAPGFRDCSDLYDDVFTRVLRSMGLCMRQGKVSVGDGGGQQNIESYARLIADWIGGPKSCQPQLDRLMKCVEPFLHPSNSGEHTNVILLLMQTLCERIMDRYYHERIKKHKRKAPEMYYLTDGDIDKFVESLLQPTLTALYNGDDLKMCTKIMMVIASLDPGMVVPKFLEHTYPALNAVCEPHRLTQTLDCLVELAYQMAVDRNPMRKKATIEKDWMNELEKIRDMSEVRHHRLSSTSYKEKQLKNQHVLTMRHHLIHLLEALTVAIDINDVSKTAISLQNITLIFHLVPIVDSSPCIKLWKDLTDDEKHLCELTAILPSLAVAVMDKILLIIQCLSICAPKDSIDLLGGLKDEATRTGEEERSLKKYIDRCVSVMLSNCSGTVAKELVNKTYQFMSTNQFESAIATDLTSGVVAQVVFARPEYWTKFTDYVLKKLKVVLTPEVRKQKDVDSIVLWYVNLASSLFCTTSEVYVKNKDMCFDIISVLLECECKVAHEVGATGLWFSLFMLSRTYPLQQHQQSNALNRPLKEWVPIREWAQIYQEHEVSLAWHVPDESRKAVIKDILVKFMFPLIERLKNDKIDTLVMRKLLNQMNMCFCGAVTCLPLPPSGRTDPVNPGATVLPSAKRGPTGITNAYFDIPYTDGRNVREVIVELLEGIMKRLEKSNRDDSQSLCTIASFLRALIDDKSIDVGEMTNVSTQTTEIFSYLNDPVLYTRKITLSAYESFMHSTHLNNVCREHSFPYSVFQKRVMHNLLRLSLNDYPEVRVSAQSDLNQMLNDYPQAKEPLIEELVKALDDPNSSEETMKGALAVVKDNKFACTGNVKSRIILWNSLINMKMIDRPIFSELLEVIWSQIGTLTTPNRKDITSQEVLDFTLTWWKELPRKGVWEKYNTEEKLEEVKKNRTARRADKKKDETELISLLLQLYTTSSLHHTRSKICRTMLWRCQRQNAKIDTIKVLLSKLLDEEEYLRNRCSDELSFWLKKNKPKTIRMDWKCPQRPDNCHLLLCGLRQDNLCVAYDSENLPNTEEKWNKMVFFTRQFGCYKWDKTVSVVTYASNNLLDRKPLNPAEAAIVQWFENAENVNRWVNLLLVEKRDELTMNDGTWWMVKYLLRNFPGNEAIFNNLTSVLKQIITGRDRANQRLAAEFFLGIAKGTKYLSFSKLDELWKWLAPAVDKLYDQLNNEAEGLWLSAISKLLNKEDPRRFWWLIEQLIVGMNRPAPSAWHQAVRSDIIPANKWRDIEIRKRICEIAWNQLPTATIEMQRVGVSTALKHICTIYDTNLHNDLSGLPERFQLRGTDFWLKRFEEKLESIWSVRSSMSMSDSNLVSKDIPTSPSPAGAKLLLRQKSENNLVSTEEDKERSFLIYLRTLLEFLLQYYEDCMTCLTPGIIAKFPMLIDYATEDEAEDQSTYKDVDIKQSATLLVHEYMGSLLLKEKYADSFLNTIINVFNRSCQWRAKVSVLKYLQVIVFSNVYVSQRGKRPAMVEDLMFKALADVQNEVRQEAARCLLTLTHCKYIKLCPALVNKLAQLYVRQGRRFQHGAILGYGALVMAHPYSTPAGIIPVIRELCKVNSANAEMQSAATKALREFRRSHRDNWDRTTGVLGPQLVYLIENAIAPVYYA